MFRALIFGVLFWGVAGCATLPEDAAPLVPAGAIAPASARGALVWLHGAYNPATESRPDDPAWIAPLQARGYDLWYFNRAMRPDPLASGGERLAAGLAGLRRGGYRRIVVAGFSRGAFIGLSALARPDLIDGVVAVSPAAHGPRPERRAEALAAFGALMRVAGPMRLAFFTLLGDRLDPGPDARAAAALASAPGRAGLLMLVDRPAGLSDHMGSFTPEFAARFGQCIADFLDEAADASACQGH